jgi:hypothetical protein
MKHRTSGPPQPDRGHGGQVARQDPGRLPAQDACQEVAARLGAGSSRWQRSVVGIAVAATGTPSRRGSP